MSRSTARSWRLVVAGCGTAGLACVRALLREPFVRSLAGITLIDRDEIEEHNAITCPAYAGFVGYPKVHGLAELVHRWCGELMVTALHGDVTGVDWRSLLLPSVSSRQWGQRELILVLVGLDDFQSRLCVTEDLRQIGPETPAEILNVQIGLQRDQAVVSAFSGTWEAACPACFLSRLPAREPCLLLSKRGRPLRGNLQREVGVAADHVVRMTDRCLTSGIGSWVNRKTTFTAVRRGSRRFRRRTRRRRRMPNCFGPHTAATPLRWDDLDLNRLEEVSDERW